MQEQFDAYYEIAKLMYNKSLFIEESNNGLFNIIDKKKRVNKLLNTINPTVSFNIDTYAIVVNDNRFSSKDICVMLCDKYRLTFKGTKKYKLNSLKPTIKKAILKIL